METISRTLLALAALTCAVAVAAGAFGAHGLEKRLDPEALDQWKTAAQYLMYGGFGALLATLAAAHVGPRAQLAAWLLLAGGAVFAGAVGGLALGLPRWLGAVAPIGGTGLIVGFVLLAWAAFTG